MSDLRAIEEARFELGSLEAGMAASFFLVDGDPNVDPSVLATPALVVLDGRPQG